MGNLPKDNQNKNSNIIASNLGDDLSLPKEPSSEIPEIPEIPKTPEVTSEIEKTPENIPEVQKEINKEEINQEITETSREKTIEIGSLDEKTLISTLNQETIPQTDNGINPIKKNKKGKTIASFIAILLIIVALPLSLILVKQRQDIRKEAAVSGGVSFCGISINPAGENYNNGTYNFSARITNNTSQNKSVEIHSYGCACSDGNLSRCGTGSGKCSSKNHTKNIGPGGSYTESVTVRQPNGGDCGTFQADVFVVSVNGDSNCHNN